MKQAVILGAGSIGRGFIGQLFSESGYAVTFVDVDQPLLDALNARHAYTIRLVDNDWSQDVSVEPVSALHASDRGAVAEAISTAEVMATAVGARALPFVAPNIAAGVRQRMATGQDLPLSCIVCENLKGAAATLRDMVHEHLNADEQAYMHAHVGLIDTVIGRMVPPLTPTMRARDPSLVLAEPYKELPVDRQGFVGPIPAIASLIPCEHFGVYTARKLYVHNCGHAVLAYMGYLCGYTYGYEALADPQIDAVLQAAWQESIAGQVAHYLVEADWLGDHAQALRRRFANRALGDTVIRLGRDPIRKLRPDDRLVAPARLAQAAGVPPRGLAQAIAAALRFDSPEDPIALELQRRLSQDGIDSVLASICQIQADEPLADMIRDSYAALSQ